MNIDTGIIVTEATVSDSSAQNPMIKKANILIIMPPELISKMKIVEKSVFFYFETILKSEVWYPSVYYKSKLSATPLPYPRNCENCRGRCHGIQAGHAN